MERIVVAIDPAVTATKKSDETGIIVVGRCGDHAYPLEDLSGRWSPQEWGKRALEAFYRWKADAIIAEVNQGGDLVEANLRTLAPNVPYHSISAMRGKIVRAEPVASLYEQGRVHHVGILPDLEDQLTNWAGGATWSPDRLDALVHGITALLLTAPSGDQTVTYDDWEPISRY
jgi:phage terminase large subunit-like protein